MALSTAIDASAVASVTGIESKFQLRGGTGAFLLPQRIAVIGQGATAATYSTDKQQHLNATSVANAYGFGSPLHKAAQLLFPLNGDGVGTVPVTFYPLEDASGAVAEVQTITPAGTATAAGVFYVLVNGERSGAIVVSVGTTAAQFATAAAAAINANISLPAIGADATGSTTVTSKWAGSSSAGLVVSIEGPTDAGLTFAVATTVTGLLNPDVDSALNQIGEAWETIVVNCLEISDTTTLDKYSTFNGSAEDNSGRWGAITHKPFVCLTGNTSTAVTAATVESDTRKTDLTNVSIPVPGTVSLPLQVAARAAARIGRLANNVPAHDYENQTLTGVSAGTDSQQWNYVERDTAVKAGSATTGLRSGELVLKDVVTMYHPDGDPLPAYRFVVDIIKLMNVTYNIAIPFESDDWSGAPLIEDNQPTAEPTAKKPKMAKAVVASIIDGLGLAAILTGIEASKAGIMVEIDSQNPKRLNIRAPVTVSGNTNIKSVTQEWSFLLGTGTVIA